MLYKADSLHDRLGGIFAGTMVCSVSPLDAKHLERARGMDVHLVCGGALLSLPEKLIAWSRET